MAKKYLQSFFHVKGHRMRMPKSTAIGRLIPPFGAIIVLLASVYGLGASKPAARSGAVAAVGSSDVIDFLSKTIDWYRQTAQEQQLITEPTDVTFFDDNRRVARQVVQLAFDFARQQAAAKQPTANPENIPSQYQSLSQLAQGADQEVENAQAAIPPLQKKLETATPKKRADLESLIAETQSEVALLEARRDVLHSMVEFVSGSNNNGVGASGLRAQIEELAHSVPSDVSGTPNGTGNENGKDQPETSQAAAKSIPVATREPPSGIWGLAADLIRLSRKDHVLKQEIAATDALTQSGKQLRQPLVTKLKAMIQSGDQLAKADTNDPTLLAQQKQELDKLTAEFKATAGAILPLSKQGIVLDLYKRSLLNWEDSSKSEFKADLKNLLARLAVLLVIILVVMGLGEVWKRTIYRYVQDTRRRYQFLLLRRIVLWIVIALIIAFTFATELGSVVTFAGLITAGVAVALQNVIVSMVGYFFLIGKFGIRVGDHVQVSGVSGEVVDIGLVRFHLMEMGSDGQPTGRVVAFSNSIVFQPASGLFKQIPGTSFLWHEIDLTFAPDSDYHAVRDRVTAAVDAAFAEYHEKMENQRRQMEMTLSSISAAELKPKIKLHFTASGIEVNVRYPVELDKASEIDDRIMRELLATVEKEPRLKLVGSEMPTVKAEA